MLCMWAMFDTRKSDFFKPGDSSEKPNRSRTGSYSPTNTSVTECSERTADNPNSSSTRCLDTRTHAHMHQSSKKHSFEHARKADTHSLYQRLTVSECVSTIAAISASGQFQQVADTSAGSCRVHFCVCSRPNRPWPPSATDLACSHFFFLFPEKNLCVNLSVCARACVCVPSFLCASPHKRTQKPGTMQRALAEETDFCPTPTNRKLLSHPPHPAFVSHADTHTCMHADGKRNHAVPEH